MTSDKEINIQPFQRLNRVINNTEIKDVFLKKCTSDCFVHFSSVTPSETSLRVSQKHGWFITDDNKILACFINYKLSGFDKNDDMSKAEKLFEIECEYCIEYNLKNHEEVDQEDFEVFASTNAYYNAYSYIRQHIQNECIKLRLSPVVLPFLKPLSKAAINQMFSEEKDSDKEKIE